MSRRPLNRARKFIFNDAMVDAFRAALAAPQDKAFAAWQHLDVVTNRKPWQFPMHDPDRDDELQQALIAKLSPDELELWQRHAKKHRKDMRALAARMAR